MADEAATPYAGQAKHADMLVSPFNQICLRNRGSWDGMKQAVLASSLGFKAVGDAKGRTQADYMAFPTFVSLKRFGTAFACIVESVVADSTTETQLADRLIAEGFGLGGVSVKPEKNGLVGAIPGTGRSTGVGILYTNVHVRLRKSTIQGTSIAQLAVTN